MEGHRSVHITAPKDFISEDQRYDYPLNSDSLVVDCGGFRGDFARRMNEKYGCNVFVSEPVFCDQIRASLEGYPNISVTNNAVGAIGRMARFGIAGDSTGQYAVRDENKEVKVMSVLDFIDWALRDYRRIEIDLLKLNIEGMEYEVLDELCGTGNIGCVKYLQVQFHGVAERLDLRIEHLVRRIRETHDLEWGSNPFLWLSFKRRGGIVSLVKPHLAERVDLESPINRYFDAVIVVNLSRRRDRFREFASELWNHGINAVRIEGCDMREMGNDGCTWAHRKVLDIIASSTWNRVLVLEDDFKCEFEGIQARFGSMIPHVPEDWDILYLGGHYADAPIRRINPYVIQIHRMKTTSSYGITRDAARRLAPSIYGGGPIDELFSHFTEQNKAYIFQPRLMVQRGGYSDLQRLVTDNSACMQDTNHENMV